MTPEEAREWIAGTRSYTNIIFGMVGDRALEVVRVEQADAAAAERAYWVLRAQAEGLTLVRQ